MKANADLSMVVYRLKDEHKTALTIGNVLPLLGEGKFTPEMHNFLVQLHGMLDIQDSDSTIFMSMHSGSSDYFTYSMLVDYINSHTD